MRLTTPVTLTAVMLILGGCSHMSETQRPGGSSALGDFYWPYAAIAADVYDERSPDPSVTNQLASPWLRSQVQAVGGVAVERYEALWKAFVDSDQPKVPLPVVDAKEQLPVPLQDEAPGKSDDCGNDKPLVPLSQAVGPSLGKWQRVPEIRQNVVARGWSVFVPDLAINLWRREIGPDRIEYAIVYRGTVGGGGWLSNFRSLTAFTPVVWDQYRQARNSTAELVSQILKLHEDSDRLLGRTTEVFITAVGHSLGAGIASYIYYVVPQVTRVVGFDPSPVDAASTLSLEDHDLVMTKDGPLRVRKLPQTQSKQREEEGTARLESATPGGDRVPRRTHPDSAFPDASMFFLYERGDVLSRFFPCSTGRLWGAETDPYAVCESVNLLNGTWIQQHNMARLACALYLVSINRYAKSAAVASPVPLGLRHARNSDP